MGWNRSRFGTKLRGNDYTSEHYRDIARRVVERIHPGSMRLKVVDVIEESPSCLTFRFERVDGPLPAFSAGQYLNVFFDIDGVGTSRPFSISSAPDSSHLDLTVRRKDGGFVSGHIMDTMKAGDEVQTTGPSGWFHYEPLTDGEDLVFLAGGSGITPFISMLRDFAGRGTGRRVHLLYGSRLPDDVIFRDELRKLEGTIDNLTVTHVMSEPPDDYDGPSGFLDTECIAKAVGDVDGRMFYLCGPPLMLDMCRSALDELGVPRHRIRAELYGPPDDVTLVEGWPSGVNADAEFNVEVNGGKSFKARACEPLINSLERNGVVVPAVCRSGECSACRTHVLSGRVFMPPGVGVREADIEHGYVHACVAYPVEDIRIRL